MVPFRLWSADQRCMSASLPLYLLVFTTSPNEPNEHRCIEMFICKPWGCWAGVVISRVYRDCRLPTSSHFSPKSDVQIPRTLKVRQISPLQQLIAWKVAVEHAVGELMFGINLLSFSVTDEEVGAMGWTGSGAKQMGMGIRSLLV